MGLRTRLYILKPKSPTTRSPICELNVPWNSQLQSWVGAAYADDRDLQLLDRRLLGVVSSHLNRNAFASHRWQNALLSALSFARQKNATILFSASTPYAAAIHNACIKTNSQAIAIALPNSKTSLTCELSLDKCLLIAPEPNSQSSDTNSLPFLDRVIVALSHQLFVLDIDPSGKTAALIERRLCTPEFPKGSVFLVHSTRTEPVKKQRWIKSQLDRGAVAWLGRDPSQTKEMIHCHSTTQFCQVPIFSSRLLTTTNKSFLIHCTRARQGAWPDQSPAQFYDELLIKPWLTTPSSFESLLRILESKRLVASSHLKQGITPTISFTQRSLHELLNARTFESHLARWDWEPYGLMIDREWLAGIGCQPVDYLKREEYKQVPPEKRPFTQPYEESNSMGKKGRDWRVEQEWRLPCDLRLYQIPFSKAIVFVQHRWEATALAAVSHWPICYTQP